MTDESRNVIGLFNQTDPRSFLDPLGYFKEVHFRQSAIHRSLTRMVDWFPDMPPAKTLNPIIDYLNKELPLHFADEEESLFPILTAHSLIADPIDGWTGQLNHEHGKDGAMARKLVCELERVKARGTPSDPSALISLVTVFTECQDRHLAWENIVIIPHAEIRLGPRDLRKLGYEMAARRNLGLPQ